MIIGSITQGIKEALAKARETSDAMRKAITTTSGFAIQSWEKQYKNFIPLAPTFWSDHVFFRGDASGSGMAWKYLKSMDTTRVLGYVAEGMRGAAIEIDTKDGSCGWSTWGIESAYTQESGMVNSELLGEAGTEDLCVKNLMQVFRFKEDRIIFGGNKDAYALGKGPTPSAAIEDDATAAVATGSYTAKVVALTHDGFMLSSLSGGVVKQQTVNTPVGERYTVNGGCSTPSDASGAGVIAAANGKRVKFTITPRKGDVAYAWYIAKDTSAGADADYVLQAVTTSPVFYLTASMTTSGRQNLASLAVNEDMSQNALAPNGIFAQLVKTSDWVYWKQLSPSEADFGISGGKAQILEGAIKAMYDQLFIGPESFVMGPATYNTINDAALADTSLKTNFVYETFQISPGIMTAARVKGYLNTLTGDIITFEVNRNVPDGMIVGVRTQVVIPGQAADRAVEVQSFGGVWRVDWAPITRSNWHGAYRYGGIKLFLPGAFLVIQGLKTPNYGAHVAPGYLM